LGPQAGLHHPGVVDHQQIARPQFLAQIPYPPMATGWLRPYHKHPRLVPRLGWHLGNGRFRQLIVIAGETFIGIGR
jgi:hypothetical protein